MASLLARVVLGAGIAAAVMLCGPAVVEAQPGPAAPAPSAAQKEAAKKLVDQAIAAQEIGDYDKAIDLYKKAFALVPHPILMFNIGQAQRLAGRLAQAIPFYERYLVLEPSGTEAPTARTHLATIKAAGISGGGSTADIGAPTEAGPARPAAPPPAVGDASPPVQTPEPGDPLHTDTLARPGRSLRIAGLAVGGVGLACAAVGGYFTTRVMAIEDEAAEANQIGVPLDAIKTRGDAAERKQDIAYILAGGLVVGGAVTYYLGYRNGRATPTTALAPIVRSDFAGVVLSGSLP
jgi:tetratricopeptide (TPR) repeat protein